MKCEKCHRGLYICQVCNGKRGSLTCSNCKNTGMVCAEHGGYWQK
jgi:hypothetical protein